MLSALQTVTLIAVGGVIYYGLKMKQTYKGHISRVKDINTHRPNHYVPHHITKPKPKKQKKHHTLISSHYFI